MVHTLIGTDGLSRNFAETTCSNETASGLIEITTGGAVVRGLTTTQQPSNTIHICITVE